FEETAVDERKERKRNEGADAAAGFDDIELLAGELENVAFAHHGNAEKRKPTGGEFAGELLERQGDTAVNEQRNADHEEQEEKREGELAERREAPKGDDHADQGDDEGRARDEKVGAEGAEDGLEKSPHDQQNSPGVRAGRIGRVED